MVRQTSWWTSQYVNTFVRKYIKKKLKMTVKTRLLELVEHEGLPFQSTRVLPDFRFRLVFNIWGLCLSMSRSRISFIMFLSFYIDNDFWSRLDTSSLYLIYIPCTNNIDITTIIRRNEHCLYPETQKLCLIGLWLINTTWNNILVRIFPLSCIHILHLPEGHCWYLTIYE